MKWSVKKLSVVCSLSVLISVTLMVVTKRAKVSSGCEEDLGFCRFVCSLLCFNVRIIDVLWFLCLFTCYVFTFQFLCATCSLPRVACIDFTSCIFCLVSIFFVPCECLLRFHTSYFVSLFLSFLYILSVHFSVLVSICNFCYFLTIHISNLQLIPDTPALSLQL